MLIWLSLRPIEYKVLDSHYDFIVEERELDIDSTGI